MIKNTLRIGTLSAVLATALAASGCGTTPGERAVSGGLLGAGTGAAFGSLSGNAGTGAVIGGVGGAALGAVTSPPRDSRYSRGSRYSRSSRYSDEERCVRWSRYSGRCLEWD
jgi:osmotically inducible lipoprotein OsmB